jgi:hypothetical protein
MIGAGINFFFPVTALALHTGILRTTFMYIIPVNIMLKTGTGTRYRSCN